MKDFIKADKLSGIRQTALEKLETMGLPTKKTEEYRYFDTRDLLKKEWDLIEDKNIETTESKEIIIVDGKLYSYPSDLGFKIFYSEEEDIDKEHFDPMYYLGHALSEKNLHIDFKSDCSVTLRHVFSAKEKTIPYRITLNIAENIHVKLFDILEDMDTKDIFVSSGYDITVGENATFTLIQEKTTYENGSSYIFSHNANVEPCGTFNLHTFDFGEGKSLQLIKAKAKEEANINSYHLLFAKEQSNIGTVSKIIHQGKNSKSTQKAKNILQDKAKGIFDALINIQNSAKGSITHQNSQAILLNDGAFMASKPQLEIYIDDVEASHGSTIGELDKDQLFYLRSRGIQENEAKKLLILAFANEMIDNLENDKIKEYLHQSFDRAYYDEAQLECISTCHNCEDMVFKEK
jgi:Fe-S cluster assembly protein SufD